MISHTHQKWCWALLLTILGALWITYKRPTNELHDRVLHQEKKMSRNGAPQLSKKSTKHNSSGSCPPIARDCLQSQSSIGDAPPLLFTLICGVSQ